jgi:hypothetical protein
MLRGISPHDIRKRIRLLTLGAGAMFLVGLVLVVIVRGTMISIAGFVLISLSGLVFVADAKNFIIKRDRNERE